MPPRGHTETMETVEYAPGRLADLFGESTRPTALVWHGMQSDARAAVRPLAELLARHGIRVIVPDWNSHAVDRGRQDLLASASFALERNTNPDGLVLVGWSMGGLAAAGLTLQADRLKIPLVHTVCLAGAFAARDPISGGHLDDGLSAEAVGAPFTLLHGVSDDVIPVAASRTFAARLEQVGWRVEVVELDTDHGAIAGARYDPAANRYLAAEDPQTQCVARHVADRIAAVIGC
jgi:dipeptidyl aminopeptidase/acylaminoacyl peptidase